MSAPLPVFVPLCSACCVAAPRETFVLAEVISARAVHRQPLWLARRVAVRMGTL